MNKKASFKKGIKSDGVEVSEEYGLGQAWNYREFAEADFVGNPAVFWIMSGIIRVC